MNVTYEHNQASQLRLSPVIYTVDTQLRRIIVLQFTTRDASIGPVQVRFMSIYLSIHLWLYSPLLDLGRFYSFLILYTDGRTPWTGDQPVERPLPKLRTARTQNKPTQTFMP
jgi:hypothetical protein